MALSVKEACAVLSIGLTKLYELIRDKEITAKKSGRRTLIEVVSIKQYLDTLPSKR